MLVQLDKDTVIETNASSRVISITASGSDSIVKLAADGATTVSETVSNQTPAEVMQTIQGSR